MKNYTAKTLEQAIELACADQGCTAEQLVYVITEEKRGLFKKTATIAVSELSDAITFAEEYLKNILNEMGLEVSCKTILKEDIINITINSKNNSIIIGKDGRTLQALTEITRLATSTKFKRRFRILLDVNNYKTAKYKKISFMAKKAAKEVLATKGEIKLEPMTSDERRIVHNVLTKFHNISSESVGEGHERAVVIKYIA